MRSLPTFAWGDAGEDWHTILLPKLRTARTIKVPFLTASGGTPGIVFINAAGQPVLAAIDDQTFGNLLFPSTFRCDNSTSIGAAELAGDITTHDMSTFLFNNTVLFAGETLTIAASSASTPLTLNPEPRRTEIFLGSRC